MENTKVNLKEYLENSFPNTQFKSLNALVNLNPTDAVRIDRDILLDFNTAEIRTELNRLVQINKPISYAMAEKEDCYFFWCDD